MTDTFAFGGLDINDHVNYFVLPGVEFGAPAARYDAKEVLRGPDVQGRVSYGAPVTMRIPMMVQPSTPGDGDQTRALIRAINGRLGAETTFLVQLADWSSAVTFDTLASSRIPLPGDQDLAVGAVAFFDLVIDRRPFGRLPQVSVGPTTLNTPCAVDLSAMQGESAETVIDALLDSSGGDIVQAWVAYVPPAHAAFFDALGNWVFEVEGLTWTNAAAHVSTYGYPSGGANNTIQVNSVGDFTAYTNQIDFTNLPPASYEVLCRCGWPGIANVAIKLFRYPGSLGAQLGGWLAPRAAYTGMRWESFGHIYLPYRKLRGSTAATARLAVEVTGGATLYIDRLACLPTQWGYWHWEDSLTTGRTKIERVGDDFFVDDVCRNDEVSGVGILGHGGCLLVVSERQDGHDVGHTTALTHTYYPLVSSC